MKRIVIIVVAVWFLALGGCGKKESRLVSGDSAVLIGTLERNVHGYELKLVEGKHFSGEDICDEGIRQSVWLSGEQKMLDGFVGKTVEVAGRLDCPRGGWVFTAEKVARLKSKGDAKQKTIAYAEADLVGTYVCHQKILSNNTKTMYSIKYDADGTYVAFNQSRIDGGEWDIDWVEVGAFKLDWPQVSTIRRGVAISPNLYGWEADTKKVVSLEKVLETNDLKLRYKERVTKRIVDGEIQSDDFSHPSWTNECDRNESAEAGSAMDFFKRKVTFRGSSQKNSQVPKESRLAAAVRDLENTVEKLEQSSIQLCQGFAKTHRSNLSLILRNAEYSRQNNSSLHNDLANTAQQFSVNAKLAYKKCTCQGDSRKC